jgi:hypothetical protein
VKGTWRESSVAGDPGGKAEKALETSIFPHRIPIENPLEGLSTGDFERRIRGALGMEHLTLKRLRERALREASFTSDLRRYVKKGFGYRNLHRSPFIAEKNLESRGRFIYWVL